MQEVQSSINSKPETMLQTIEAVGTSSRKIIYWRQTTTRFASWCTVDGEIGWYYTQDWSRVSPMLNASLTQTSLMWGMEYRIVDKKVRVPIDWTYSVRIDMTWGSDRTYERFYVYAWNTQIFYYKFDDLAQETISQTVSVNLGKFDTISARWYFQYTWNSAAAQLYMRPTITITQL